MISYDRNHVREANPLIHCITNPISMHACANTILAVGGKPIMAEHPREVSEITATAGGLLLNLDGIHADCHENCNKMWNPGCIRCSRCGMFTST